MTIIITIVVAIFLYIFQGFLYRKCWNKGLSVHLSFSKNRVFEKETLVLYETIANKKFLPLPWLSVKFQISSALLFEDNSTAVITDAFYRNDLFSLMTYQKINRHLNFVCSKRGYYTIKSLDMVSSDLFISSARFIQHFSCDEYLYVYPRLISIEELLIPYQKFQGEILTKRYIIDDPFEFRGIREYQSYDGLKAINWKATAKTGELKVNLHDYTASQEILIFINFEQVYEWYNQDILEESISLAASLATYYINDGVSVGIVTNSSDILTMDNIDLYSGSTNEHLTYIYESLARISPKKSTSSLIPIINQKVVTQTKEPFWVIISNYCENDFQECYAMLRDEGFSTQWIIPDFPSNRKAIEENLKLDIEEDNIYFWEMKPNV